MVTAAGRTGSGVLDSRLPSVRAMGTRHRFRRPKRRSRQSISHGRTGRQPYHTENVENVEVAFQVKGADAGASLEARLAGSCTVPDSAPRAASPEIGAELRAILSFGEIIPTRWERRTASGIDLSRVAPPSPPSLATRRLSIPWSLPPEARVFLRPGALWALPCDTCSLPSSRPDLPSASQPVGNGEELKDLLMPHGRNASPQEGPQRAKQ
jgi:hypothetical protein